jgi:hypothetical protein
MHLFTKTGGLPAVGGRGRPFAKGNPGRKPGSKNKITLVADALLRDEENELTRKAIELAKDSDVVMLKFLLSRILPKERSVRVDIPHLDRASDAAEALGAIIGAVSTGQIAPNEAAALGSLVADYAQTVSTAALEARLHDLETRVSKNS